MGRGGSCPGNGFKLLRSPGQDLGFLCHSLWVVALLHVVGMELPPPDTGNGRDPSSSQIKPGYVPSSDSERKHRIHSDSEVSLGRQEFGSSVGQ